MKICQIFTSRWSYFGSTNSSKIFSSNIMLKMSQSGSRFLLTLVPLFIHCGYTFYLRFSLSLSLSYTLQTFITLCLCFLYFYKTQSLCQPFSYFQVGTSLNFFSVPSTQFFSLYIPLSHSQWTLFGVRILSFAVNEIHLIQLFLYKDASVISQLVKVTLDQIVLGMKNI